MMTIRINVAIVGGGIAGLWLLARLRQLGYSALLLENKSLGYGQSMLSQGILHVGPAYQVQATAEGAPAIPADMPAVWNDCLNGTGAPDLSGVRQLSRCHHAWIVPSRRHWLLRWLGSKAAPTLDSADAEDLPAVLNGQRVRGWLYRLDEPVVDNASLLQTLATDHWDAILLNQGATNQAPDGGITLRAAEQPPVVVQPDWCVYTAGVGNTMLTWAPLRMRTLQIVLARGGGLPGNCYLQCLDVEPFPALTITSHVDRQGRVVWYLGGLLARQGSRRPPAEQIQAARRELHRRLPWLDLSEVEFSALRVARVSPAKAREESDPPFGLFRTGHTFAAWPASLAATPLLVDAVVAALQRSGLTPRSEDLSPLRDWPRPGFAACPWDDEQLEWQ